MDVRFVLSPVPAPSAASGPVEIVERKGSGHPDTICDAIAETAEIALARYYRDRFGAVLHHNLDKVLLVGGQSRARFGGGEIVTPIELTIAGRATREVRGVVVPIEEIVTEAVQAWLRAELPRLGPDDVRLHVRVHPGAPELVGTFLEHARTGRWLANDTSIGAGFAPLTRLERAVLEVERELHASRAAHPERGTDIKVMGVRRGGSISLTVSCAMIASEIADARAYAGALASIGEHVRSRVECDEVAVNAADDLARGDVYLTVSGTSAEWGDDGEAGRGNRANGLITPMRPMTLESVAGKNPVSHVGKIYNLLAHRIAEDLVAQLDEVHEAEVFLVSRIGAPVSDPAIAHVRVRAEGPLDDARIEPLVRAHLERTAELAESLLGS